MFGSEHWIRTQVLVCVVFTLDRRFYPASSTHPVSVLIPYPRNIYEFFCGHRLWDRGRPKNKYNRKFMGQASEVPAYRVREHKQHKQEQKIKTKRRENKKTRKFWTEPEYKWRTRRSERLVLIDGSHTYSGRTDSCCTDEATRKRHNDGGEGKGNY